MIDEQPQSSRPEANWRFPSLAIPLSYFSQLRSPSIRSTKGCPLSGSPIRDSDFLVTLSLRRSDIISDSEAASAFAFRRFSSTFVISSFSAFDSACASAHSFAMALSFMGTTTSCTTSSRTSFLTWSLISSADALRAASICFLSSSSAASFFDSSLTERRMASSSSASLSSVSFFALSLWSSLREMAFAFSTASSSWEGAFSFSFSFFESSIIDWKIASPISFSCCAFSRCSIRALADSSIAFWRAGSRLPSPFPTPFIKVPAYEATWPPASASWVSPLGISFDALSLSSGLSLRFGDPLPISPSLLSIFATSRVTWLISSNTFSCFGSAPTVDISFFSHCSRRRKF